MSVKFKESIPWYKCFTQERPQRRLFTVRKLPQMQISFNKYERYFSENLLMHAQLDTCNYRTCEMCCLNHHHKPIHFSYKNQYFLQLWQLYIKYNNNYTSLICNLLKPCLSQFPSLLNDSSIVQETLSAFSLKFTFVTTDFMPTFLL